MKGNVARNVAVVPGAGRTTPWVGHWARNAELGGWRKTQFGQGVIPGKLLSGGIREGNGRERSPANGYVVSHRTDGNCAAKVSVRSAIAVRPEQEEVAVRLPVSSSYAAVMGKQPELVVRSNRRVQRVRSRFSRSARVTEE